MDKLLGHSPQMAKKQGHKTPLKSGIEWCNDCVAPFKDASEEESSGSNNKRNCKGKSPKKEFYKRQCTSPLMVEDIIEGFAFASFKTLNELNVSFKFCLYK